MARRGQKRSPANGGRSGKLQRRDKEIIEVSSSVHDNTNKQAIAEKNANQNDDKEAAFIVSIQEMTTAVTGLTKMLDQQNLPVFPAFSGLSPPYYHYPLGLRGGSIRSMPSFPLMPKPIPTQVNSFVTSNISETERIMSKLTDCSDKTKSTPEKTKFTKSTPETPTNGYYIHYKSPSSVRLPEKINGPKIPQWLSTVFRPPKNMNLNDEELVVAAYIFGPNMSDEKVRAEILVKGTTCDASRETLTILVPKSPLDQDILTLTSAMLFHEVKETFKLAEYWFMPTMFSQYALSWEKKPSILKNFYSKEYMGFVENVYKIFVPINYANMHYHLAIADLEKKQVLLLDSKPSLETRHKRRREVQKMVNKEDRMRLAIDREMKGHNKVKEDITKLALDYFKSVKEKQDRLVKSPTNV
ncbi:hypothetical protein PIB30_058080 [Stylosanthes scabra]|uniref:Ubiquitin-like protease family profile domain-containing protein n=1 Tax=Stylosanthes scabra TaxID=79078 RepID=A0ABU6SJY9_9FABA|nr:hypothetical protein [Stylosanthes scabra]